MLDEHFTLTMSLSTCLTAYTAKFMAWLESSLFAAFHKRLDIFFGATGGIAFNRAKSCPSKNACDTLATYRAVFSGFRTCVITSIFPVLQFCSYHLFQLLILPCANNIKRQRKLALSSFNNFTLPTVCPFPTLDFNVISIINKKIRTVIMLSSIRQFNEKFIRFIYKEPLQIFQITSIISFPARATINSQIGSKATFAERIPFGYSVRTWFSDPRQSRTFTTTKAGNSSTFSVEFVPALETFVPAHIFNYNILSLQLQSMAQKGVM